MAGSFADITVPEGEPGALRGSANRLKGAASGLREAGSELEGMPSAIGTWQGPASGHYAVSCLSQSEALGRMAEGWMQAATITRTFADDLEQAREEARAAIEEARDATRRIKAARTELAAARERFYDAVTRADTARAELGVGTATGVPQPGVQEQLGGAEADADQAEGEIRTWRNRLERAEDDLERAQRRGERAERDAEQAANRARLALGAIDAGAPNWVAPSAPALKALPGPPPKPKFYEQAGDWLWNAGEDVAGWGGDQVSQIPGGFRNGVNGLGGMLERGYRGSQITRLVDPDSYDPTADPHSPLYDNPLAEDPVGFAKGLVNWDDFSRGRVGEGAGELLPGFLLGGLGGAAVRTAPKAAPKTPAPSKPAPAPAPAPKPVPNLVVRDGRDGSVLFRTGPDGQLVREGGEPIARLGDLGEQKLKDRRFTDGVRPGEQGRHGTPPPPVKTKKGAVGEALRAFGRSLEDLGG